MKRRLHSVHYTARSRESNWAAESSATRSGKEVHPLCMRCAYQFCFFSCSRNWSTTRRTPATRPAARRMF